ncbi:Regulator of nonsense transcripts upf2, variant 2 [Bonamia ostreae]|uniref:Regulator of nonsense transcripts upf2, variant 2 n=1 Tax=Bonamia ostreae TaxID=126728 RepID=A0ABV2AU00_9EUKA
MYCCAAIRPASIVAALNKFYSIGVIIVDAVLEEIRMGLETNSIFEVQRRFAFVLFLGELYIYRITNSQVIFDTLYLLITFQQQQFSNSVSTKLSFDPFLQSDSENKFSSGDYFRSPQQFRVTLVCSLLQICGRFFKMNRNRKRLDRFMMYFQRFVLVTKAKAEKALDIDTEFAVEEIFDVLRPRVRHYKLLKDIDTAIKALYEDFGDDGFGGGNNGKG